MYGFSLLERLRCLFCWHTWIRIGQFVPDIEDGEGQFPTITLYLCRKCKKDQIEFSERGPS